MIQPSGAQGTVEILTDDLYRWRVRYTVAPGFVGTESYSVTFTEDPSYPVYPQLLAHVVDFHVTIVVLPPGSDIFPVGDNRLDTISADEAKVHLGVTVDRGVDAEGDPIPIDDGSVIAWRLVGPGGATLERTESTTVDGFATNTLTTTTLAGDSFTIFAKVIKRFQDGVLSTYNGAEVPVGNVQVVAGVPAQIDILAEKSTLPADGKSTTKVALTVTDAAGNPVADGTPLGVVIDGSGKILESGNTTTTGGKATINLQAGVYAGTLTVSVRAGAVEESADIDLLPIHVNLGISGNAITLGTDETATVTATVADSSGTPVADGTLITWFIQKGGFLVKDSQVNGGVAALIIRGTGGSQVPGNGMITASVGSTNGSLTYLWVAPPGSPWARIAHPVLAGDKQVAAGTYLVEQADGTTKPYDYFGVTSVVIPNAGNHGDVVAVHVGNPGGGGGTGPLVAIGNGGQTGSYVVVTVNGSGEAVFKLQSMGLMSADRMINVPVTVYNQVGEGLTTFNISLQPAETIARTRDYVGKLGYGIIAGPGNSLDEIAADVGFSLIPVIGAYTDIRDIFSNLTKLWPGGESPNWLEFGFAVIGVFGSFLGPEVDWLPTLGKKMAVVLDASKGVWKTTMDLARQGDAAKLDEVREILTKIVGDALTGDFRLRNLAENFLVNDATDLARLSKVVTGLGDDAVDLLKRVADNPELGGVVTKRVVELMSGLSPAQMADIKAAGQFDNVAAAIGKGLKQDKLAAYATWLNDVKANPLTRIPNSKNHEYAIDKYLINKGSRVEPNLQSSDWIPNTPAREGDRFIDGLKTEYKSLKPGATSSTIRNDVNLSLKGTGQARIILIDARQSGLTEAEALRGLDGVAGITRGKLDKLRIILPDGRVVERSY